MRQLLWIDSSVLLFTAQPNLRFTIVPNAKNFTHPNERSVIDTFEALQYTNSDDHTLN